MRGSRTLTGTLYNVPSYSAAKNSSFVDRTYITHFVAMHLPRRQHVVALPGRVEGDEQQSR